MSNFKELVEQMVQRDVGFYCTHEDHSGQRTVHLTSAQLIEYLKDPVLFLANLYGVTSEQYLSWHRSGYAVVCSGTAKNGKPCKQVVQGGSRTEPKQWVQMQGTRCSFH